jgi:hypothetical protein
MIEGWVCPHCSASNAAASLVCSACGQARPDDAEAVAVVPPPDPDGPGFAAITKPGPSAPPPGAIPPPAAAYVAGSDQAPEDPGAVVGWLPPSGTPPPEATGPVPLWRRLPIGLIVFIVLIAGAAIGGWYFNAGRSSTGELTKAGDLQAVELKVGDCFDLKDPSADEVNDVTAGPCTTEHEFELFFVGTLAEGAYPADDVFDQYVVEHCNPAFATYIGTAYDDSELDIYWLVPTDDAWRSALFCAARHWLNPSDVGGAAPLKEDIDVLPDRAKLRGGRTVDGPRTFRAVRLGCEAKQDGPAEIAERLGVRAQAIVVFAPHERGEPLPACRSIGIVPWTGEPAGPRRPGDHRNPALIDQALQDLHRETLEPFHPRRLMNGHD